LIVLQHPIYQNIVQLKFLIKNCIEHLNVDGKIILHDFTYPKNYFVRKYGIFILNYFIFWDFYS